MGASNVSIVGAGVGQTVLRVSPSMPFDANDPILVAANGIYPSPPVSLENITISDITVDGNQRTVRKDRPYPNDTHGNGINLNRCHACKVLRTEVRDVVYQGIVHTGDLEDTTGGGEVAFNTIDGFGEIGVGIENHSLAWRVHDNVVRNDRVLIPEFRSESPNDSAVGILVGCVGCVGARMSKNVIESNRIESVRLAGASGNIGIKLDEFSDGTIVNRNTIIHSDICIRVSGARSSSLPSNVAITENHCEDSANPGAAAIDIAGWGSDVLADYVISGNTIERSGGSGIVLNNVTRTLVTSNVLTEVGLSNKAAPAIGLFTGAGVYVKDLVIQENKIQCSYGPAIHIDSDRIVETSVLRNQWMSLGASVIQDSGNRSHLGDNVVLGIRCDPASPSPKE